MIEPEVRWSRSPLDAQARDRAVASLSPAELARFATERPGRRDGFLAGRALLRTLAGEVLGIAPADVPFEASCPDCSRQHGRPTIVGSDLQVSLAHRADAVVAVAVRGRRVGIDLERPGTPIGDLTPLIQHPSLQRWTSIEAVLKADGRGLRVDPGSVVFETDQDGEVAWVPDAPTRYRMRQLELAPGVAASLAVELA